jgi:hypothetical protein
MVQEAENSCGGNSSIFYLILAGLKAITYVICAGIFKQSMEGGGGLA